MKFLFTLLFVALPLNNLISDDYDRIGVNYTHSLGIHSLSANLNDNDDIFETINSVNLSFQTDFEVRHIFRRTKVQFNIGHSNYSMKDSAIIENLNSLDFFIGFGNTYSIDNNVTFYFLVGSQISYLYDAPVNFSVRNTVGFPYLSLGVYFNIISSLELKTSIQSGLFNNRLLGIVPNYEIGLIWRY